MKSIKQAESELEVRIIELNKEIEKKKNQYEMQLIQSSMEKQSNITIIDNQHMLEIT